MGELIEVKGHFSDLSAACVSGFPKKWSEKRYGQNIWIFHLFFRSMVMRGENRYSGFLLNGSPVPLVAQKHEFWIFGSLKFLRPHLGRTWCKRLHGDKHLLQSIKQPHLITTLGTLTHVFGCLVITVTAVYVQ